MHETQSRADSHQPDATQLQQYDALIDWDEPLYRWMEDPGAIARPWLFASLYAAQLDRTRDWHRPLERARLVLHRDTARNVLRRLSFELPPDSDGYELDAPVMMPQDPKAFHHEVYSRPAEPFERTTYWKRAICDVGGKPKRTESMRRRGGEWTIGYEPPDCDVFQLRTLLDTIHPWFEKDSIRPLSRNHRLRIKYDMMTLGASPRNRDRRRATEALQRHVDHVYPAHKGKTNHWHSNYQVAAEGILLQRVGWRNFGDLLDRVDEMREQRFLAVAEPLPKPNRKVLPGETRELYNTCLLRRGEREHERRAQRWQRLKQVFTGEGK